MSMIEWATREVEIACKRERGNAPEDEWDYGCACYESALKAYKCLCEDGHSGMSFSVTRGILKRLMDGNPLTPIEDTSDAWNLTHYGKDGTEHYQCKRKSSLFKDVFPDGTVTYSDVDRTVMHNVENDSTWHNGFMDRLVNELFPITMPYCGESKPYGVYVDEFLTDPKHGDYDTWGVLYIVKPDGAKIEVNRYFSLDDDEPKEISYEQYCVRKKMSPTDEQEDKP